MKFLTLYQKMVQTMTMQPLSKNYFKPQFNTEYEVFKCHKCEQMADEIIDAYCTRLRELAKSSKLHDTDREVKTQKV